MKSCLFLMFVISKIILAFNGDTESSMGFNWHTDAPANSHLQIIEKAAENPDFSAALIFEGESLKSHLFDEYVHKATATGLKPATHYVYRVGDIERGTWSQVGEFRTADPKAKGFSFVAITDTQGGSASDARLSASTIRKALALTDNAAFILHSGDFVDTSGDEKQWRDMIEAATDIYQRIPIMPAAGNHDRASQTFWEHFNIGLPDIIQNTKIGEFYSYDYKNAHFITLNTNDNSSQYANMSPAQVEWLRSDVANAREKGAEWIILNMHKGPYTVAYYATQSDIDGKSGLRTKLAPIIEELGIDLVFQGHDHYASRTKSINGTVYINTGSAGVKTYEFNQSVSRAYLNLFEFINPKQAIYGRNQSFGIIEIEGNMLNGYIYSIDQQLNKKEPFMIDSFSIQKSKGG